MMTLFGDLRWEDPQGLRQWLAAHDLKHQALAQALGRAGVPSPAFLLADEIDENWIDTHATVHNLLALQFAPDTDAGVYDLLADFQEDQPTFYAWHDLHNQIHQRLDQALGIT